MAFIDDVWYPSSDNKDTTITNQLNRFTEMMSARFPEFDLNYSFKDKKFLNQATNNMFKVWELGQNK